MPTEKTAPKDLTREIASLGRDYAYAYGGRMANPDQVLQRQGAGQGLKLYEDLARDPHVHAVLSKRKRALVGRAWSVEPASDAPGDVQAADLLRAELQRLPFDRICLSLLGATLKGFAVGEILWEVRDGILGIQAVKSRASHRFRFDTDERLHLLVPGQADGELLPDRKFIVHREPADDANPYGQGLGGVLYWPVFFKRRGLSSWLVFSEKFGQPTVRGSYPQGTSEADQQKLLEALSAVAEETAIVHPAEMSVELLEAARNGNVTTYEQLCRFLDEQISEAVLGETGTTNQQGSGGSRARDQVGNEVRLETMKADGDLLAATLNATLAAWFTEFNVPGAAPPRIAWDLEEPEDLVRRSERDKNLKEVGYRPSLETVAAIYGEGYELVPQETPNQTRGVEPGGALPAFAERDRDRADELADQAVDLSATAFRHLIAPIRRAVKEATSLQDLRDRLDRLYPSLDARAFTELMAQALAVAEVSGRWDVLDGR